MQHLITPSEERTPKTKLDLNNYYSPENNYLSYSKLKVYLRDKRYFKELYLDHSRERSVTDSMVKGSALDCLLFYGDARFNELYRPVKIRNLKNPPEGYTELTPAAHEQVLKWATAIRETTAYQQVKDDIAQEILQYEWPTKYFAGYCGIPDWYRITDNLCVITDLKSSNVGDDARRYAFACRDFGYFMQQAMYQFLLKKKYPAIAEFQSRHLVVAEDSDGLIQVRAYILDQQMIEAERTKLMDSLREIEMEKEFAPNDPSFDRAEILSLFNDKN